MAHSNKWQESLFGKAFWEELVVYAILVGAYLLLVLKTLDRPLADLFRTHPVAYAFAALLLVLVQGIALDLLTSFLVGIFRKRR